MALSKSKKINPNAKNRNQGSGSGSAQVFPEQIEAQREEEEESSQSIMIIDSQEEDEGGNEDGDEEDSNADEISDVSLNDDSEDHGLPSASASASGLVIRIPLGLKCMAPIDKPRTDKGTKYAYI
jgi:hypothetical protein